MTYEEQDPTEEFLAHIASAKLALSTAVADAVALREATERAQAKHDAASEAIGNASDLIARMPDDHQGLAKEILRPVQKNLDEFRDALPAGIA